MVRAGQTARVMRVGGGLGYGWGLGIRVRAGLESVTNDKNTDATNWCIHKCTCVGGQDG